MAETHRFAYRPVTNAHGEIALRPMLSLRLTYNDRSASFEGLLDTGADVNVLPYRAGLELGAVWLDQNTVVQLSGNLGTYEARGIILQAVVADFPPVRLAFAWTQLESVPLLLGQVNFFLEFNVCFYRAQRVFELSAPLRA